MDMWFTQETAGHLGAWIGSTIGLMGALIGIACGVFVQKGLRKLVYAVFALAIAVSVILLALGLIALVLGQPYHVWYAFGLPGLIGTIVFSCLLPVARNQFTQIEFRRMQANDL